MKASGCEVELSRNRFTHQEAFVSHANAALTPRARLRLARLIVEDGWTPIRGGEDVHGLDRDRPQVGGPVPGRRAGGDGRPVEPAAVDARTRPRHRCVRQIVRLRWRHRLGPVQIGGRLGMPASTVHAVLVRCRINRLSPHRPGHRRTDPPLRAPPPGLDDPRRRHQVRQHPRRRRPPLRRPPAGREHNARDRSAAPESEASTTSP